MVIIGSATASTSSRASSASLSGRLVPGNSLRGARTAGTWMDLMVRLEMDRVIYDV